MSDASDPASTMPLDPGAVVAMLPAAAPSPRPAAVAEPAVTAEDIGTARRYADASRAASTQRAYASDWRRFSAWCAARQLDTLPADPRVVAVFLAACSVRSSLNVSISLSRARTSSAVFGSHCPGSNTCTHAV